MRKRTAVISIILLFNTLCCMAQNGIVFDDPHWDFGTIREEDGPVVHRFTARNRGDRPEVIVAATSACSCTAAEFPRRPILPGEEALIAVTFDPRGRAGSVSRRLAVFTSEGGAATELHISGQVIGREKSPEELYPVDCGEGLRLEDNFHALALIPNGRSTTAAIGCINLSSRSIGLELRPLRSSGRLQLDYPRTLPPGARGEILLGYDLRPEDPCYGTLRELLAVLIDGRQTSAEIFLHGFAVDAPPAAEEKSARWELNKNIINFGSLNRPHDPAGERLVVANRGDAPLVIRAVEAPEGVECSLRPGDTVVPGGKLEAVVRLVGERGAALQRERLVLIANDPQRPVMSLRLTTGASD